MTSNPWLVVGLLAEDWERDVFSLNQVFCILAWGGNGDRVQLPSICTLSCSVVNCPLAALWARGSKYDSGGNNRGGAAVCWKKSFDLRHNGGRRRALIPPRVDETDITLIVRPLISPVAHEKTTLGTLLVTVAVNALLENKTLYPTLWYYNYIYIL